MTEPTYDWPGPHDWDKLSPKEQRYRALELFREATFNRHSDFEGKWTPAQRHALNLYDLAGIGGDDEC